jgi:hypothetical protein
MSQDRRNGDGMLQHCFWARLGDIDMASAFAQSCFPAGTPLRTPDGSKSIEEFQVGDEVVTAADDSEGSEVVVGRVAAVLAGDAPTCSLTVAGGTIRTTAEHPFWVRGAGWRHAQQLEPGDELRCEDGRWLAVDAVEPYGPAAPVFNVAF